MKRRSTFIPINRLPWWTHPLFMLPLFVSVGLIGMVLILRITGLVR